MKIFRVILLIFFIAIGSLVLVFIVKSQKKDRYISGTFNNQPPGFQHVLGITSNLVVNSGFENGLNGWFFAKSPTDTTATQSSESSGCFSGKCLKMTHGTAISHTGYQQLETPQPNQTYELNVKFKTALTHYGYVALYNPNWNKTCDAPDGKSFSKLDRGDGTWKQITLLARVPALDDCGVSSITLPWRLYLYSQEPTTDSEPIWYDNVEFGLTNVTPPAQYIELEEQQGWSLICQTYNDALPLIPCNTNAVSVDTANKKSGQSTLLLTGTKEKQETVRIDVPVKPNTTYKTSMWVRIADRATFNYLDLDYPSRWKSQEPNILDTVELTKGIWSGDYDIAVNNERINQPLIKDAPYRSATNIDWFPQESYFKTDQNQISVPIVIKLLGYEGKLFIDGVTVKEVASHIDDRYFHIPITKEFEGMKIAGVSQNPLSVKTNAAEFRFTDRTISQFKGTTLVSTITAPTSLFAGLTTKQEQGLVILENQQVLISIGADSVMLVKLKTSTKVSVSGPKPGFFKFDAGVIFATDYTQGILFSPLRTRQEIFAIPRKIEPKDNSISFSDTDIAQKGLKYWDVRSSFDQPTWNIEYDFKSGDGFVSEVFPPKTLDEDKLCKTLLNTINIDINQNPNANYDYLIQNQKKWSNFVFIWMNNYESITTNNPVTEYCTDSNKLLVSCSNPAAANHIPVGYKFDVTGPYTVSQKAALQSLVAKSHASNLKVIMYMSPQYYFTYDTDRFLKDVNNFVTDYNIDGVYFDGIFEGDPLKTLELVRKTRNLLGDKIYVQHNSRTTGLLRGSSNFRAPFEDIYADLLWVGEGVKDADTDTWKLNYCGQNVSNTVSQLLSEMRPVDYTLSNPADSIVLSLSPETQINNSLACNGLFRTVPGDISSISEKRYQSSTTFETQLYTNKLQAICLPKICGDNVCDTIETIFNCPRDCAPPSDTATVAKQQDKNICQTNGSIAQWTMNNTPWYTMHYTFDNPVIDDTSGNANHPLPNLGVSFTPPPIKSLDNQKAAYFSNKEIVNGSVYKQLTFNDKPFSTFMRIKREGTDADIQVIFLVSPSTSGFQTFYVGISNGKLYLWFRNGQNQITTFTGTTVLDSGWHTIGFVYQKPSLKLFVDGQQELETQTITLDPFAETNNFFIGNYGTGGINPFKGYIDDFFIADKAFTPTQVSEYAQTKFATATFDNSQSVQCLIEENGNFMTAKEINGKPGDANGDVKVDGSDYTIWLNNYGRSGNFSQGDFNGDGKVTGIDYVIWLVNFGK